MAKTKFCIGVSEISDSYSGFIIDQWGVLHNGKKSSDEVIEALKQLKARKKFVILIANKTIRADENRAMLKKMGIGPSLYTHLITPSELIYRGLESQSGGVFENIGHRCLLLEPYSDRALIEGLDRVEVVERPEDADFMLITPTDRPRGRPDEYDDILKRAVRRRLKALCANPESVALLMSQYVMGPGLIARRYQQFGGVVHHIGKPHRPIFQHCISLMQEKEIYPGQTVVIGDAMAHDILGGSLVEMDTALVKSGVHAGAFKNAQSLADVDRALNILIAQHNNIRPRFLIESFQWGKPLPDRKHKKHKKHRRPVRKRPVRRRGSAASEGDGEA